VAGRSKRVDPPKMPKAKRRSYGVDWIEIMVGVLLSVSLVTLILLAVDFQSLILKEISPNSVALWGLIGLIVGCGVVIFKFDRAAIKREAEEYKIRMDNYTSWRDDKRENARLELEIQRMQVEQGIAPGQSIIAIPPGEQAIVVSAGTEEKKVEDSANDDSTSSDSDE